MKYTLLEMTQEILSAMDSDEVDSISDTTESMQIARVIRKTYFNIMARANLPEAKKLFQLDASTDADQPTLMSVPSNVSEVYWVKYNTTEDSVTDGDTFIDIQVLKLKEFLDLVYNYNSTETDVGSFTFNGATFYYKNDAMPQYCTVVDDFYVVFDSFDENVESTLQSNKTVCYGQTIPEFIMSDTFTPTMDEQQFPLLLAEATTTAFIEQKQVQNPASEREAKRQWTTLQRTKKLPKMKDFDSLPNFSRNSVR